MAMDHVGALRAVYAEWAVGNTTASLDMLASDVLFEPLPDRAEMGGVEGIVAYMTEFLEQWDDYRIVAEEFIEVGDGVVVVVERQSGTGVSSGVEMVQAFYAVWRFRGDEVSHIRWEGSREAAIEVAGVGSPG